MSALAALERTTDIDEVIAQSYGQETKGAPVRLMSIAASELSLHGREQQARGYALRTLQAEQQSSDSIPLAQSRDIVAEALRILGRYREIEQSYDQHSREAKAHGIQYRILAMRYRVLTGDTTGALALVDSARTQPLSAYASWELAGMPLYYGAQILSLLGRKAEAVEMLREAMNKGVRLGAYPGHADEPLMWYWAPIKDYPPFQELVKIR